METKSTDLPEKPFGYHDTREHAYKERTLADYRHMVFPDATERWLHTKPDNLVEENWNIWPIRLYHRIDHFTPKIAANHKDTAIVYDWN